MMAMSAPAGSGKTFLLRSWMGRANMSGRAAWVQVPAGERDPQRFWIAVADALRATVPGTALVRPLTAAPDLDGVLVFRDLGGSPAEPSARKAEEYLHSRKTALQGSGPTTPSYSKGLPPVKLRYR